MSDLLQSERQQPHQLRDYQQQAIDRLRDSLRRGKRRPLLQSPTGSGKTLVSATLVNMALAKGKKVCFVVPALSLIDQAAEMLASEGIWDVGIIQAKHSRTDWSRPVQICSVQTLARRWPSAPEADMVICDESHLLFEHYGRWMRDPAWLKIPFIGLSATPWTKGLGKLYDDLIVLATTGELIERGYLSPFRVFAPGHPDLKGVRTVAGDYHEGELSSAMNQAPLVADVVKTWLERAEGQPTLCFAVDRAHAKHLQQQFEQAGVSCGYQDMNTNNLERRQIRDKFHAGELKVVTSVDTLCLGVDWDVRCISMVRPTKSIMKFVQQIGRALRTAPGKTVATILDHSDNHLRLGFVTDIQRDGLNDGRIAVAGEKRVRLPKECPQCSYLRPPRVSVCPNCGFKPEARATEHAVGELIELSASPKLKLKQPKHVTKDGVQLGFNLIPFRELFGQLRGYGETYGYKPAWASNKYRELTGVWPNHYRDAPSRAVCGELAKWIKGQNIRWAKSHAPR